MPMRIVTHNLTQKDFEPDGKVEFIEVKGHVPSWWERIKERVRGKPKNVKIHKHSEPRERHNI